MPAREAKRVGERGEGKWEQISWEQGLDEVASRLKKIVGQYGGESVGATIGTTTLMLTGRGEWQGFGAIWSTWWIGDLLGALVVAVARRLDWTVEPLAVAAAGGVFEAGRPLRTTLEQCVGSACPNVVWQRPLGSPVEGAILLAQEEAARCPS